MNAAAFRSPVWVASRHHLILGVGPTPSAAAAAAGRAAPVSRVEVRCAGGRDLSLIEAIGHRRIHILTEWTLLDSIATNCARLRRVVRGEDHVPRPAFLEYHDADNFSVAAGLVRADEDDVLAALDETIESIIHELREIEATRGQVDAFGAAGVAA